MISWADIISTYEEQISSSVLVTVGAAHGSTPRETGARMVVMKGKTIGTIGGGQLEHLAIKRARELLTRGNRETSQSQIMSLPLGPELGQCCGGHVDVLLCAFSKEDGRWIAPLKNALSSGMRAVLLTQWQNGTAHRSVRTFAESFEEDVVLQQRIDDCLKSGEALIISPSSNKDDFILIEPVNKPLFHLTLFGAGHVGKAVVGILAQMPCAITWVDERADMFPASISKNVETVILSRPEYQVQSAPKDDLYLVMTHSHQRDLDICTEILKRDDAAYIGVIGSHTKKQKFLKRLKLRGIKDDQLSQMTCPIGLPHLKGKHPVQIAISVSAEILNIVQAKEQISIEHGKIDYAMR